MKLIILETPYAGDIKANIIYARKCIKDCMNRNESPIASHLLYTQPGILDDNIPSERDLGINAGLAWYKVADYAVIYQDLGISSGMKNAIEYCIENNIKIEYRYLS